MSCINIHLTVTLNHRFEIPENPSLALMQSRYEFGYIKRFKTREITT